MESTAPISRNLIRIGRVYQHALAREVEHLDINRYHDILVIIYNHSGSITQKGLAKMLNKDKSALVSIIDLLTEKGYVYRETNPADRREHLLKTTEKAEHEVLEIIKAFAEMNKKSTENISAADMRVFNSVLSRMETNLKKQLSNAHNLLQKTQSELP